MISGQMYQKKHILLMGHLEHKKGSPGSPQRRIFQATLFLGRNSYFLNETASSFQLFSSVKMTASALGYFSLAFLSMSGTM